MKIFLSIIDVKNIKFYKNGFITIFNDVIKFYNYDFVEIKMIKLDGNSSSSSCVIGDIFFAEFFCPKSGFEDTFFTHVENLENRIYPHFNGYLIRSFFGFKAIALKYDSKFNVTTSLLNLENGEILWNKKMDILPYIIKENLLISALKNKIARFSFLGNELWIFDTTLLGTWIDYDYKEKQTHVKRFLGEYNANLYIYLNSGQILVIDTETGEKVNLLENDKNTDQGSFSGMFMSAIELDQKNGKLILLFNQRYTDVDLSTGIVTQVHLDDMKEKGLENMDRFVFNDEYIFFSDRYHQKVASLNRETLKVDWVYDLNDNSGIPRFAKDIKLNENKLFILDNKNSLLVFEDVKSS